MQLSINTITEDRLGMLILMYFFDLKSMRVSHSKMIIVLYDCTGSQKMTDYYERVFVCPQCVKLR